MKKYFLILILFTLALLNYSCDESINPNAKFRERYILNGIMRGDTTFQTVTLAHSYQPDGLDPLEFTDDPAIRNAEVNIYYDNKLYHMRDTTIVRLNTSHYQDSLKFYYNSELKPGPNQVIEIDALLPNGLLLQSESLTPNVRNIGFFEFENDKIIPPSLGSRLNIKWQNLGKVLYAPKLFIHYYVKGDTLLQSKEVPLFYYSEGGSLKGFFPTPVRSNFLFLELETIQQAISEIPQNGKAKSEYTIVNLEMQLMVYDEYLSTYYSSVRQGVDGFTIKLDNPDYSNIKNGFGIFGSFIKTSTFLTFTKAYLNSLGFN